MKRLSVALLLMLMATLSSAVNAQESPPPDTTDTVPVKSAAEDADRDKKDGDDDEKLDPRGKITYSLIGISRVSTDFDNLSEAINLNGGFGIRVPTVEWIAAEIGISTSIIPGDNDGRTPQSPGIGGGNCVFPGFPPGCTEGGGSASQQGRFTESDQDFGVNIVSVQGVLKSPGMFYAVGKYGYRYVDSNIQELVEKASGKTYSFGGGYRYGSDGGVELMYTKYAEAIDGISILVTYGFGGDYEEDDEKGDKDDK